MSPQNDTYCRRSLPKIHLSSKNSQSQTLAMIGSEDAGAYVKLASPTVELIFRTYLGRLFFHVDKCLRICVIQQWL